MGGEVSSDREGYDQVPDEPLLRLIANGDETALATLYERHRVRLYKYLVRVMRNEALVEEALHDAFLAIWQTAGRFEGRSSVTSWMFSIAHNKAVSALRKRREVVVDDATMTEIEDPGDSPADVAEQSSTSRAIRTCMDTISEAHRAVVELTYFQDLPIREIAVIVDCPENTVKTRMFHARRALAECLEGLGIKGEGQ